MADARPSKTGFGVAMAAAAVVWASGAAGCADFGYAKFGASLNRSIEQARAKAEDRATQEQMETPQVDSLIAACAPEGAVEPATLQFVDELSRTLPGFAAIHRRAFRNTVNEVRRCIYRGGDMELYSNFSGAYRVAFPVGYVIEKPLDDMKRFLAAIQSNESEARGKALIQLYVRAALRAADPFARIHLKGQDEIAPGEWLRPPVGDVAKATLEERERATLVRLRVWTPSKALDSVISALEQADASSARPLVLDLRMSAGDQPEVLERLEKALERHASRPIVVWTDRLVRGTPEVLAVSLKDRANVLVLGSPTAGYTKVRCQAELSGAVLEFGCGALSDFPSKPLVPHVQVRESAETSFERERLREFGIDLWDRPLYLPVSADQPASEATTTPIEESIAGPPKPVKAVADFLRHVPLTADALEATILEAASIWARSLAGES